MRRTFVLLLVVGTTVLASAGPAAAVTPGQFAGHASGGLLLVGAQLGRPAEDGSQPIRLYVCNSVPDAEWFAGTASGDRAVLLSKSGRATAHVTIGETTLSGRVRLASGATRRFTIPRASHGAGIYEITVTGDRKLAGRSAGGDTFVAQQTGNHVRGFVVTKANIVYPYRAFDLARLSRRVLRHAGLPTGYAGLAARSNQPGDYVAVAATIASRGGRRHLAFFGVDKSLLSGTFGRTSIITLDRDFNRSPILLPPLLPSFP